MQVQSGIAVGSRTMPADGLLHPVALLALVVLVLNDHFLKAAYPGLITGKLSDFAGLILFPLLLQGAWEVCEFVVRGVQQPRRIVVIAAIGITAVLFSGIKLSQEINGAFSVAASSLVGPSRAALDPTDLVALPALAIAYLVARRRFCDGPQRG